MLSLPSLLSQSTPSLTISETDSLYMAVTTLHHELKSYAPEPWCRFDSTSDVAGDMNTLSASNGKGEKMVVRRNMYLRDVHC